MLAEHLKTPLLFKDTFVKKDPVFQNKGDIAYCLGVLFCFFLSPSLTDNAHVSLSAWSSRETLGISAEDIHKVEKQAVP